MTAWIRSRASQAAGVVLAFLVVAALHVGNDGLWFGDAPLHAGSGLFWWDLLTMRPANPAEFAIRYYARYPIVQPTTYPPLFYIAEGLAFASAGASPHVAKLLVLSFGILAGLYTMAWGRRWIGPVAGWAGAFLAFVPGMVIWSNAVMLNMPAMALGLGSLYHFRRWLDTAQRKQIVLAVCLGAAVLLTYYPGAIVLCVIAALGLLRWRDIRFDRSLIWIGAAALCACIPLAVSVLFSPIHTSRNMPSVAFLAQPSTWMLYWWILPNAIGWPALTLGLAGAAAGFLTARWRGEATYLVVWFAVLIGALSLLPARDPRYILPAAPAFALAAAIGVAAAVQRTRAPGPTLSAALLIVALVAGFWYAARVPVPTVAGFRDIALYLAQAGPHDAVLYDGPNSALLGFYVRVLDPNFERRVTEGGKLLYQYGPGRTFAQWTQTSKVASTQDVVRLLRTQCGCRWVAVEAWPQTAVVTGRQLLREAVVTPDFEFVRSFPITGARARQVDLYRLVGDVDPVAALDLSFPSFTTREFHGVVPITR